MKASFVPVCISSGVAGYVDWGINRTIEYLAIATENNYPVDQLHLGVSLRDTPDRQKCTYWMRQATENGRLEPECEYGRFLYAGVCAEQDEI